MASPLWTSLAPAVPSVIVGIAGFWVVHHLSKRRQARDETFKLTQTARDLAAEIAQEASDAWGMPARKRNAASTKLIRMISRLGHNIQMLRSRSTHFNLSSPLVVLRQAVTKDIEINPADLIAKRDEIFAAADALERGLDTAFLKTYS